MWSSVRYLIVGVLVAVAAEATGALRFERITADNGLPSNWVQGITKDSRGFLWIGTQDGLVRYDAGTFSTYRQDPKDPQSLPFQTVRIIFEDSKKNLWLGSHYSGGGLAQFDPVTGRFRALSANGGPIVRGVETRAIVEDHRGHLWFGTNQGLSEYDTASKTFNVYHPNAATPMGLPTDGVTTLKVDEAGRLWIGTDGGLRRLNPASKVFEVWGETDDPLLRANIEDLLLDKDGSVWVATNGQGLHHLASSGRPIRRYRHDLADPSSLATDMVRCLASDGNHTIFIGTENGGLNILDQSTDRMSRHLPDLDDANSLTSSSIYALHYDDQGILWIGTFNGGLNILTSPGQRFETIRASRSGLSDPHVQAILEDHTGTLWVGTDGGGLSKRDARTGRWTQYKHDPRDPGSIGSDAILTLVEDHDKRLWIGGWDASVARYDPAGDRFVPLDLRQGNGSDFVVNRNVFALHLLSTGEVAVGTFVGFATFDPRTGKVSRPPVLRDEKVDFENVVFTILEDSQGNVWLGRDGRVDVVERRSGKVVQYRHDPNDPNGLGLGRMRHLYEDSRGNLWVATESGLNVMPAGTRTFQKYGVEQGMPHKIVNAVLEDAATNLWVSTNAGIAEFAKGVELPTTPTFRTFGVEDGLQGLEFSGGAAFKNAAGRMYFGGSRGLSFFAPDRIELNLTPPPVILTGLRIFNRPVMPGVPGSPLEKSLQDTSEIVLSYQQSMVTFDFAALNYLLPQKNEYAYKLEGLDPDWNGVGTQRSATYTNVSPGDYTFRVRAANNDGVWNEQGARLKIRVTPPFWATLWFRALVMITFGAALYAWYQGKMRAAADRRRELEALVRQRTADLEAEIGERKRTEEQLIEAASTLEERNAELQSFADVASHDLQEPLRKVSHFADRLDASWESLSRTEIADTHRRMKSAAGRMQALIAQLLAYARLGKVEPQLAPLDMSVVVQEVLEDLEARIEKTGGRVQVGPLPTVHADPIQLRQLVQNLVANALKFARPDAFPVVRVYATGKATAAQGPEDARCEIAVQDNGIGFEQAEADHVFRPFYRLHTRQKYEGTGLGLAICQKIVERHGGVIRAVSAPGEGTTFFFTLALVADANPAVKSA